MRETKASSEAAIDASIKSADAATRSADVAVAALNRPWLIPEIIHENLEEARHERTTVKIEVAFRNYGSEFAEITACWFELRIWFQGWPVKGIDFATFAEIGRARRAGSQTGHIVGSIVRPNDLSASISDDVQIGYPGFWEKIFLGQRPIRAGDDYKNIIGIVGELLYDDPYGQSHVTAFCFRQNYMGDGFIADPNPDYRYRT